LTFRFDHSHVNPAIEDGASSSHHVGGTMLTKHSAIRSWFAAKRLDHEQLDSSGMAGFVTRLGDVKVETRTPGGKGPIDHVMPVENFPD
jgi:hypothetical protein